MSANSRRVVLKGKRDYIALVTADHGIPFVFVKQAGGNVVGDVPAGHIKKLSAMLAKHPEFEGRFAKGEPAMKKRKASPAQIANRKRFAAMARARAKNRRPKRTKRARKSNPPPRRQRDAFQIAAAKGDKILYLSGVALTSNREAASNYGTVSTARKIARQVRDVGKQFGITRVAVVTNHDHPRAIRSFLLGEA